MGRQVCRFYRHEPGFQRGFGRGRRLAGFALRFLDEPPVAGAAEGRISGLYRRGDIYFVVRLVRPRLPAAMVEVAILDYQNNRLPEIDFRYQN